MEKFKPVLSILIPTRNRESSLLFSVQSALAIDSEFVEILVSDNWSHDDTWGRLNAIADNRLRLFRPPSAVAMHEHWEFLLAQAQGDWVTFIGDDDAILPYSLFEIESVSKRYPWCEAIYSARSYYFWPKRGKPDGVLRFSMVGASIVGDSTSTLRDLLNGTLNYLYSPQIYSGGFLRRTLVNRVRRASGRFFMSAVPDASSAVNCLSYTTNYIRHGIPLSIVGTSPVEKNTVVEERGKDRVKDFYDFLPFTDTCLHPVCPDLNPRDLIFPVAAHFSLIESFCSSIPFCRQDLLDGDHLVRILIRTIIACRERALEQTESQIRSYFSGFSISESMIEAYAEKYSEYVPDPMEGSVIYTSNAQSKFANISQAADVINIQYKALVKGSASNLYTRDSH